MGKLLRLSWRNGAALPGNAMPENGPGIEHRFWTQEWLPNRAPEMTSGFQPQIWHRKCAPILGPEMVHQNEHLESGAIFATDSRPPKQGPTRPHTGRQRKGPDFRMRIRMLSARTESLWDRPGHPTSGTLFRYAFARFSDPRTYAPSARLTPSNAIKKLVHTPMPALPHFFLPLPPPVHARLAGPIRKRSKEEVKTPVANPMGEGRLAGRAS